MALGRGFAADFSYTYDESAIPCQPSAVKIRGAHRVGSAPSDERLSSSYFMCLLTSFVISNIDTFPLPPKTARSLSSALIMRRFC